MNIWGYFGLLWIWVTGSSYDDGWKFWCNVLTTVVFFVCSIVAWFDAPLEDDDDEDELDYWNDRHHDHMVDDDGSP